MSYSRSAYATSCSQKSLGLIDIKVAAVQADTLLLERGSMTMRKTMWAMAGHFVAEDSPLPVRGPEDFWSSITVPDLSAPSVEPTAAQSAACNPNKEQPAAVAFTMG
jgi:hypothetical protein